MSWRSVCPSVCLYDRSCSMARACHRSRLLPGTPACRCGLDVALYPARDSHPGCMHLLQPNRSPQGSWIKSTSGSRHAWMRTGQEPTVAGTRVEIPSRKSVRPQGGHPTRPPLAQARSDPTVVAVTKTHVLIIIDRKKRGEVLYHLSKCIHCTVRTR